MEQAVTLYHAGLILLAVAAAASVTAAVLLLQARKRLKRTLDTEYGEDR